MRARRGLVSVLLAATGGMAGLGPVLVATTQPAWAFTQVIHITGKTKDTFDYDPRSAEINVGDKFLWKNDSPEKHTVTSDGRDAFDSGQIAPGSSFERRFERAGTYNYFCKNHPDMKAVIVVNDPNAPPPPPSTTTTAPTTTTTAPTTTTTAAPTTTTAPPTTTTTGRPPAGVELPPVPATAASPPPTLATSSTTTVPSSTTTTAPPTTTSAPFPAAEEAPPAAPPTTEEPTTTTGETGDDIDAAVGPTGRDAGADPATVALVAALIAVGLFGTWTLIRIRPGRI